MGEYLAAYISPTETFKNMGSFFENAFKKTSTHEGFTDIDNVFQNILKSGTADVITHSACSQSSGSGSGSSCPPTSGTVTSTSGTGPGGSVNPSAAPTAFLKTLLDQERATADSLMDTAKRISPVVQTLEPVAEASDAAFEGSAPVEIPKPGATLQGFAVLLLVLSYVAFTLVFTIFINHTTQNAYTAGKTFAGLVFLGFISYTLIVRLA